MALKEGDLLNTMKKNAYGFTIVELLVVIVIIGILAAISIVSYNGVTNKANDVAVQQDLANIAKKLEIYRASMGEYPAGSAQLEDADLTVTKSVYGSHLLYEGSLYNLLYCRPASGANDRFALIAASKSGNMFQYTSYGGAAEFTGGWRSNSSNACSAAGMSPIARDWFYSGGSWQTFAK